MEKKTKDNILEFVEKLMTLTVLLIAHYFIVKLGKSNQTTPKIRAILPNLQILVFALIFIQIIYISNITTQLAKFVKQLGQFIKEVSNILEILSNQSFPYLKKIAKDYKQVVTTLAGIGAVIAAIYIKNK